MTQSPESSEDRREYLRHEGGVEVVVSIPGRPQVTLLTSNYSESGIFLLYGAREKPAPGTEIVVMLKEMLTSDTPLAMVAQITHVESHGFGIEFLRPLE